MVGQMEVQTNGGVGDVGAHDDRGEITMRLFEILKHNHPMYMNGFFLVFFFSQDTRRTLPSSLESRPLSILNFTTSHISDALTPPGGGCGV